MGFQVQKNDFYGHRRSLVMHSLCILVFTARCIVGQQTMVSPDDVSWGTSIQSAAPGDVFVFQPGVYHACGISLNSGLTLKAAGPGVVFDCRGNGRHISVQSGVKGIRLIGVELINGATEAAGGCLHMGEESDLELLNTTLRNCSAYNVSGGGNGQGGAIFVGRSSTLSVNGSFIVNCHAQLAGGGVYVDVGGRVVMQSVHVRDCSATSGGALALPSKVSLELINVSMHGNAARGGNGGAVDASGLGANVISILGGTYSQNSGMRGGAVYLVGSSLFASGSLLEGNIADTGGAIRGVSSSIEVTNCKVSSNTALIHGGGLFVSAGALVLSGTTIEGNTAVGRGGGAALLSLTATLDTATLLRGNSALYGGGGLYGGDADVLLSGTVIEGNTAFLGGGVMGIGLTATLTAGACVRGNTAQLGGGFLAGGGALELSGGIIEDNTAVDQAGGMLLLDFATMTLAGDSSVRGNKANYGGGLYIQNGALTMSGGTIEGNTGGHTGGGALLLEGSTATIDGGALVRGNMAKFGAGLYVQTSVLEVSGASIESNTAATDGGGVKIIQATVTLHANASLQGNTARVNGAGVQVELDSTLIMLGSTIEGNVAGGMGGGVMVQDSSKVSLEAGASVRGNTAEGDGGGLFVLQSALEVSDASIEGNTAGGSGGGLAASFGKVEIVAGTLQITGNTAGVHGGAVSLTEGSALVEHTSSLARPRALELRGNNALRGDGGGLAVMGDATVVLKTTVVRLAHNVAGDVTRETSGIAGRSNRGGGLFVGGARQAAQPSSTSSNSSAATCTASNSRVFFWQLHLLGNRALGDGGGLCGYSTIALIEGGYTNATDNKAVRGGAAALSDASLVIGQGHTLLGRGNTAVTDGGAVALLSGSSVSLLGTSCSASCLPTERGNGVCDPSCLSAACNFDNGDCIHQSMDKAGAQARQACDRDKCPIFRQTQEKSTPEACTPECFTASCDWSRELCVEPRANSMSCPLIDAAAFRSIRAEQAQAPAQAPVFLTAGNSQGGFGRCATSCSEPAHAPPAELMSGAGVVGAAALHLVPAALNITSSGQLAPRGWLHVPQIHVIPAHHHNGATIEAWVRLPDACTQGGDSTFSFVLASADYAVALRGRRVTQDSMGASAASPMFVFWPLLFWTAPPAHQCSAETTILTSHTGSIGDGPGLLPRYSDEGPQKCEWILAPGGATGGFQEVVLVFTQFYLGFNDFVHLHSCYDLNCVNTSAVTTYSGEAGVILPPLFVSQTPVMRVTLSSQTGSHASTLGFTASYAGTPDASLSLSASAWHHVAASINASGFMQLIINGSRWSTNQLPLDVSPPPRNPVAGSKHGTAIGHGSPDWQEGGDLGFGEGCVDVDELRIWTSERSAADISAHMHAGCGSMTTSQDGLAVCYSFDEPGATAATNAGNGFVDSSPNQNHAQAKAHGSPYQPWCVNLDDGGDLYIQERGVSDIDWTVTKMWGYCTSKPRLPGAGFEYDEAEINLAATRRLQGTAAVLDLYPGCGDLRMIFEHNTAGRSGGAVYYDSCNRLEKTCFLQGIDALSDSKAIFMRHNKAQTGGAIYIECKEMGGECEQVFSQNNTLGALPELPKVELRSNSAFFYGSTLATQPALIRWHQQVPHGKTVVPSRSNQLVVQDLPSELSSSLNRMDRLDVSVQPFDSLGAVAKGISDALELRICKTSGDCTKETSLLPVVFQAFDSETGASSVSVRIECPIGADRVVLEAELVRFIEVKKLQATINCGSCRRYESKIEDSATGTWFCTPCASNQYVVDPNNGAHACQACPVGGTCNGSTFIPMAGSEWEVDGVAGVVRIVACAPASYIVRAPYLVQACLPCKAGDYCPGGDSPALKCPARTFSEPASNAKEACVKAEFVELTVNLPIVSSEFDATKQAGFKQSIATAARVNTSQVEIVKFSQTSLRGNDVAALPSRQLLAATIDVETRIAATDGNAKDLIKTLNPDTINRNLQKNGLPEGKLTKSPILVDSHTEAVWTTLNIILIAIGISLVLLVLVLISARFCRKEVVEKTFEESRAEAERRVEVRSNEFPALLAAREERMQRKKKREGQVEAKKSGAGDAEAVSGAPLADVVYVSHSNLVPKTLAVTVEAKDAQTGSGQAEIDCELGVVTSDPLDMSPQSLPSAASLQAGADAQDGDGMKHEADEDAKSEEPNQEKFEARELILGKSEDSVLSTFIGLDEAELAEVLKDPMQAIEKEWFPELYKVGSLAKEGDKDYGDEEYLRGMKEILGKFDAGSMSSEEFYDEKQRLADEFEERRYLWWVAGANFDYLRYGCVGDVSKPAENFWLPPQVRHKEINGWGGSMESGQYDCGNYDTPAMVLELDMAYGATGEVDSKGHENVVRQNFKKGVSADLSRSAIELELDVIAAEDLPVITVTPDPTNQHRTQVVIHVLPNAEARRGDDECWLFARMLCAQSANRRSALLQGDVTKSLVLNGVRLKKERVRTGMTLEDFTQHEISQLAGLSMWHIFALRAYTSDSYPLFNNPMRARIKPHPLRFTIYFLDQALKMLTTVEAKLRPAEYNRVKYLWRGMSNVKVDEDKFLSEGGSELAAMSTTDNLKVAQSFAKSAQPLIFSSISLTHYPLITELYHLTVHHDRFEARGRSRGVQIGFLSVFPHEKEYLYSPLTGLVLLAVHNVPEQKLFAMHSVKHGPVRKSGSIAEQFLKEKEQFLLHELQQVRDELEKPAAKSTAATGTAGVATETMYSVYDVRPMR